MTEMTDWKDEEEEAPDWDPSEYGEDDFNEADPEPPDWLDDFYQDW